jgi:hypothetical protein
MNSESVADPAALALQSELERVCRSPMPAAVRTRVGNEIVAASASYSARPVRLPAPSRKLFPQLRGLHIGAAAILATGVAGAVALGFFGQRGPTTVSAQTILRNAQKAGLTPGQTTEFTYQVSDPSGTSSVQIFLQPGPDGRLQRIGHEPAQYVSGRALVAMYEANVGHNAPASLAGATVSGTENFDGATCDVVVSDGQTLYFDAQSYILRGVDWTNPKQSGTTWHAVLQTFGPAADTSGVRWTSHG